MLQFRSWNTQKTAHQCSDKGGYGRWLRFSLGIGGCLSVLGGSGWQWLEPQISQQLDHQLLPEIDRELEAALNRPVQLGELQQITPLGIRLGRSYIPTTATDRDQVDIKAVEIRFDLVDALLNHQVKLDITLIEPQIELEQNAQGDWLDTELNLEPGGAVTVSHIRLQRATVAMTPYLGDRASLSDRQRATVVLPVQGGVHLKDEQQAKIDFQGNLYHGKSQGGQWRLQGQADLETAAVTLAMNTQNVAISPLMALLSVPVTMSQGTVSGDIHISKGQNQPIALQGTATVQHGAMRAPGEPNPITDIGATLRFQGQQIQVEQGRVKFGKIPFDLKGTIGFQQGLDLRATVPFVNAADFMQTFKIKVPFAVKGALQAKDLRITGAFDHVIFSGKAKAVQPLQFDRLTMPTAQAQFQLDKKTDQLTLQQIEFLPDSGGKLTTHAQITLENDQAPLQVNLKAEGLSADALAQLYGVSNLLPQALLSRVEPAKPSVKNSGNKSLGKINAQVALSGTGHQPRLQAKWQLQGDYLAQGKVVWADHQLTVKDTSLKIAGGAIAASAQLKDGQWRAQLNSTPLQLANGQVQLQGALTDQRWNLNLEGKQVGLKAIDSALSGIVEGQVSLAGTLAQLSPAAIDAAGTLQITQAAGLPQPLTAKFQWDGDRLHILQAGTQTSQLSGAVKLGFTGPTPNIAAMDLAVRVHDENLSALVAQLPIAPSPFTVAGFVSFDGRLTGNPAVPQLVGQLQLNRLALNQFAFEPALAGALRFTSAGLELDLKGQQDRIQGRADRSLQTAGLHIQVDQATLQSRYQQGQVTGTVRQLPLQSVYQLTQAPASAKLLNGLLSGDFSINALGNPTGTAHVNIAQPSIGVSKFKQVQPQAQNQLSGTLHYRDRLVTLSDGKLQLNHSLYRMGGRMHLTEAAGVVARVSVDQGDIQDLQGLMAAVKTMQPSNATPPWFNTLTSLNGKFSANIDVSGSLKSGLATRFGLQGQNWGWQQYGVQQVAATGQYDGQQFALGSLQLKGLTYFDPMGKVVQNQETQLLMAGAYSSSSKTGQLQLTNLPIAAVQPVIDAVGPVSMEGNLNASLQMLGDRHTTTVDGQIKLNQLQVKQIPLPETNFGFQYERDRFNITGLDVGYKAAAFQTASTPTAPDSSGAEKFYFAIAGIDFTLPVAALQTFADSGNITHSLGFYTQFIDQQTLQSVRAVLSYPVDVSAIDLVAVLNSPSGDAWLSWLGQLIQTRSGETGKFALKTALAEAAKANPQSVTLMNVLQHFPIQKIRINTSAVMHLLTAE